MISGQNRLIVLTTSNRLIVLTDFESYLRLILGFLQTVDEWISPQLFFIGSLLHFRSGCRIFICYLDQKNDIAVYSHVQKKKLELLRKDYCRKTCLEPLMTMKC